MRKGSFVPFSGYSSLLIFFCNYNKNQDFKSIILKAFLTLNNQLTKEMGHLYAFFETSFWLVNFEKIIAIQIGTCQKVCQFRKLAGNTPLVAQSSDNW